MCWRGVARGEVWVRVGTSVYRIDYTGNAPPGRGWEPVSIRAGAEERVDVFDVRRFCAGLVKGGVEFMPGQVVVRLLCGVRQRRCVPGKFGEDVSAPLVGFGGRMRGGGGGWFCVVLRAGVGVWGAKGFRVGVEGGREDMFWGAVGRVGPALKRHGKSCCEHAERVKVLEVYCEDMEVDEVVCPENGVVIQGWRKRWDEDV